MTQRLYYADATLLEFDAIIVGHDADPTRALLDRTAFYPTSGGQPHDTGALNGIRVIDVIDRDHAIVHVLEAPIPVGPVHGVVDAARRLDHMQQHSAQHLLSALAQDRWGWATASVHFGADHSTIELATASVSDTQLRQLEDAANEAVARALPVRISEEEAATATGLRKPSDRQGPIRVISIEGIDRSACGGTHVSRTSEIGPVLLTSTERIRGHVRLGFLAGGRVLARLRQLDALLQQSAAALGSGMSDLVDVAATRQQELRELRHRVESLEAEVAASRVAAVDRDAPTGDGVRRVLIRHRDESPTLLRQIAAAVSTRARLLLVLAPAERGTLYLATSADSGIDAGALLKPLLAAHGGRGGGSPRVAQGNVEPGELPAVLDVLMSP